jgi:protocatechuate 3,4-dioxygenase alpha subunit
MATDDTSGARIRLEGRVLDGDGEVVPDALIELWQADAEGRYNHPADPRGAADPGFSGFGRAGTDDAGRWWFDTIKPGPHGSGAPHINVIVFARGLLDRLLTRFYFSDEAANADDPLLGSLPPDRRATLVAERAEEGEAVTYRIDIVLQGEGETVFFEG